MVTPSLSSCFQANRAEYNHAIGTLIDLIELHVSFDVQYNDSTHSLKHTCIGKLDLHATCQYTRLIKESQSEC